MKPIYFFDMDGTLAEWRSLCFDVELNSEEECPKTAEIIRQKVYETLTQPGYYLNLAPYPKVVQLAKDLIAEGNEVYILSCAINKDCIAQKEEWLDRYLPELPKECRLFVPDGCGPDKWAYLPMELLDSAIDPDRCLILIDDHTPNCQSWFKPEQYRAIKLLNPINGRNGRWTGPTLFYESGTLKNDLGAWLDFFSQSKEIEEKEEEERSL